MKPEDKYLGRRSLHLVLKKEKTSKEGDYQDKTRQWGHEREEGSIVVDRPLQISSSERKTKIIGGSDVGGFTLGTIGLPEIR